MRDKIRPLRNKILINTWKNEKASWDMSEIAEAMNINLKTAYRILKEEREKELFNKFTPKKMSNENEGDDHEFYEDCYVPTRDAE
ncbi:MAG: hypothetical protein P1P85_05485 [Patescibacteria group bacterium]|nr:hypothetical protein [Patescibacteria group bacterium]